MKNGRYLNSVRCALPEGAQSYLDLAFAGDALAARRLMIMAPKRLRGHIAFLAYQLKTRNPAYREIVKSVWAPGSAASADRALAAADRCGACWRAPISASLT